MAKKMKRIPSGRKVRAIAPNADFGPDGEFADNVVAGFFKNRRRRHGDVFVIDYEDQFSKKWMEYVDDREPVTKKSHKTKPDDGPDKDTLVVKTKEDIRTGVSEEKLKELPLEEIEEDQPEKAEEPEPEAPAKEETTEEVETEEVI